MGSWKEWGGKGKTPRYSPMLLKLSDKVLLNFFILPIFSAGLEAGIRSHIVVFFSHRVWRRAGGGGTGRGWTRGSSTAGRSAVRGFSSPAAAAAAEHRKRRRSSSHSSHQLVTATVLWWIVSQEGNYISKETFKKSEASTGKPCGIVCVFPAASFCFRGGLRSWRMRSRSDFSPSSGSRSFPCSTATEMSFLGFLSPVSTPPDPALDADWRSPRVNRVPIGRGGWLSARQRRPPHEEEDYAREQSGWCVRALLLETAAPCKTQGEVFPKHQLHPRAPHCSSGSTPAALSTDKCPATAICIYTGMINNQGNADVHKTTELSYPPPVLLVHLVEIFRF